MRTISQRELRNDSAQILRDLADGEPLEVTVNGTSIGVLRMDPSPTGPQRWVPAVRWNAVLDGLPDLSASEQQAWRADSRYFDDDLTDPWGHAAQAGDRPGSGVG